MPTYKGPAAKAADPKVIDDMFRFIESEGQIFGEEVIRVMTWTKRMTSDVRIAGLQKEVSCPGRKRTNGDPFDPKTREAMEGTYVDAPPSTLQDRSAGNRHRRVGLDQRGNLCPDRLQGEERISAEEHHVRDLANGEPGGYIPDDASYGHQTFQVLESTVKPGCAETAIVNTIADLETQYLNAR